MYLSEERENYALPCVSPQSQPRACPAASCPPLRITSPCSSRLSGPADPSCINNRAGRVRGLGDAKGSAAGSHQDSSVPERRHSGAEQATAALSILRRCLAGEDGRGWVCAGAFTSGRAVGPCSWAGLCPLPAEVTLRGSGSPVPRWGALPAPPPAAPGSCHAVRLHPCGEAQEGAPAAPPAFPDVPRVFSRLSLPSSRQPQPRWHFGAGGRARPWEPVARGCPWMPHWEVV